MVNKESLPLIIALLIPVILVLIIVLYYYGYDITLFLRKIPVVYYIIILPIALGFTVAMVKWIHPE
ncbi:MAG: hypothetical protein DRM98_06665 [Thermoplasmata archaeon]|nr:MAG: hypothetical protein DRM98_06665 [Thermoplasmata archaeon]RLF37289.1 MAG: hypothetical protein DRM99_00755 [Thermoplasmata archaeon]RLF53724.1 MAG: hypothetical protein DRN24_00135 [Thermoplasmata archaeon]